MSICIKNTRFNKRIYEKLQNSGESPNEIMHHFKIKSVSRLANDHLNINSSCNKFDTLRLLGKMYIEVP